MRNMFCCSEWICTNGKFGGSFHFPWGSSYDDDDDGRSDYVGALEVRMSWERNTRGWSWREGGRALVDRRVSRPQKKWEHCGRSCHKYRTHTHTHKSSRIFAIVPADRVGDGSLSLSTAPDALFHRANRMIESLDGRARRSDRAAHP